LIFGGICKPGEWINQTGNIAIWGDTDVLRGGSKGRIAIGIARGLEIRRRHCLPVKRRGKRLSKDSLIGATTGRRKTI
jgi:hypothetical protein